MFPCCDHYYWFIHAWGGISQRYTVLVLGSTFVTCLKCVYIKTCVKTCTVCCSVHVLVVILRPTACFPCLQSIHCSLTHSSPSVPMHDPLLPLPMQWEQTRRQALWCRPSDSALKLHLCWQQAIQFLSGWHLCVCDLWRCGSAWPRALVHCVTTTYVCSTHGSICGSTVYVCTYLYH